MKKSLVAVALLGAFAGVAHAQTAVQIYGNIDAAFIKRTDQTLNIGKRASNTLGFKGTEDLGNGLKALFQLEMRYEPDTGTTENGTTRPLFQGQSRVGLQGDFGMVRLGRGLTPFQEIVGAFEPWHGLPNQAGFYTDLASRRLQLGSAGSRRQLEQPFSNAIFYNSPVVERLPGQRFDRHQGSQRRRRHHRYRHWRCRNTRWAPRFANPFSVAAPTTTARSPLHAGLRA
jgi:predicted porin